jgi:AraC-like DNA-binding protein
LKPSFEDIPLKKGNQAVLCYRFPVPLFPFKWHYHPEYELTYIIKGKGKRLVGDCYENFEDGDLVLIGSGLPHTWVSEQTMQQGDAEAIVVQFSEDVIKNLLPWQEFDQIAGLINKTGTGLSFKADESMTNMLMALPGSKGGDKLALFFRILQHLAATTARPLSSPFYAAVKGNKNEARINFVCNYVENNFAKKLNMEEVAAQVFLSVSAFCKFFKRATGKTFSDYVNGVKIAYACRLLTETDNPVSQVAYATGFDTAAYFNRVFLQQKKITPLKFRNLNTLYVS